MVSLRLGPIRVAAGVPRSRSRTLPTGGPLAVGICLLAACSANLDGDSDVHQAYADIIAQEDARGLRGLGAIEQHLTHRNPRVRGLAARALGRLEDPAHLARLEPMLTDSVPAVRAAAAMAVSQSVLRQDPSPALEMLARALPTETAPVALGAFATHLGRLTVSAPGQRRLVDSLLLAAHGRLPPVHTEDALDARLGIARGIEAVARGTGRGAEAEDPAMSADLTAVTRTLAATGREQNTRPGSAGYQAQTQGARRIRRLAVASLARAGLLTAADVASALDDPDWGVRRQVMIWAAGTGTAVDAAVASGLADPDPRVRVDALRAFDRTVRSRSGCGAIYGAMDDPDVHVRSVAITMAGRPCPDGQHQRQRLWAKVQPLIDPGLDQDGDWHQPVEALASLAQLVGAAGGGGDAPLVAAPALLAAAHHTSFARARAASILADVAPSQGGVLDALFRLAEDPDANVREAALRALARLDPGPDAQLVTALLGALADDDPQLVMTASRLLVRMREAAQSVGVVRDHLRTSLERFTEAGRQTDRDVRVALLDALDSIGGSPQGLATYLRDSDPAVASRAAALFTRSTGTTHRPSPRRPASPPRTPGAERLRKLARSSVRFQMEGLGDIVVALRPDLAATNADRFLQLAEAGRFTGLTFHRVEPNFVIQGGSPNANEYAGHGSYSRDEISNHPHWRGTVGLSTRGRDTGDGQLFVNVVDNVRLDFDYTIFGEVIAGMDIVDRIQGGAVIERVDILIR